MYSNASENYIRKTVVYDEDTDWQLRRLAEKQGTKVSPLIRKFIKEGLARHFPDAKDLGLSPTMDFYEILAFALASATVQGLALPKSEHETLNVISKDILVSLGVINEGTG